MGVKSPAMTKPISQDPTPKHLRPILENLLLRAAHYGAEQAEALGAHGRSLSIGVRGGELEDIDNSEGKDIGLRVFIGQKQACVSSSDMSGTSLDKLAERAVSMAKLAPDDPYCGLADHDKLATQTADLDIYDDTELSAADLLERARRLDGSVSGHKNIMQAEGASANMTKGASFFLTSHGFARGWRSSQHGLSVAAFASNGTSMERDYEYKSTRWFCELPEPETIGEKAAARAVARLGSVKMQSATAPIMFERRIAGTLLSSFLSAISGPAIARGVSFLKDSMGAHIFSEKINIIDDPFLKRKTGSRPWDGEGVAGARLYLVKDGVLQSWMLNCATARKLGLETTGHAHRGMSSPPGVACSNSWIEAGEHTPENMMQDMGEGLLVTEMFGPSLNPNTGDYSVGVAGFAIKNGTRHQPVSEITIAGNILDMFKTMHVANDLIRDEPISTPSILVDKMVIAGA